MIVIQPSYTDRAGNMMGGRSQPGQGPSRSSPSSGSEGKSEHWKHLVEVSWREERGESALEKLVLVRPSGPHTRAGQGDVDEIRDQAN